MWVAQGPATINGLLYQVAAEIRRLTDELAAEKLNAAAAREDATAAREELCASRALVRCYFSELKKERDFRKRSRQPRIAVCSARS